MVKILIVTLMIGASAGLCFAQASGNIGYSQNGGYSRAKQNERNKRGTAQTDLPPNPTGMFIEASVLMNVKADEYVAVFGIAQECTTVPECNQKMDAVVTEFSGNLVQMGINRDDMFVDFVTQNRIYGYKLMGDVAKEDLVGFELKKNVSVHYKDKAMLDKLIVTASRSRVYDLIKVDYIVKDQSAIQDRLMQEAARIIKQKAARYENLLGIKLEGRGQVYAEKPSIYYPTYLYDSYVAQESEGIQNTYSRDRYTIQNARKSATMFFNGLDADGFDYVINPVLLEPVVQFTLYLKIKYDTDQPKPSK
ncbi:MAG TPA: SIMPL domain-containing protein [Blastocatellia bacterium]|nr:SIMPL domain-containing protein [Blastocatellia bacterium]